MKVFVYWNIHKNLWSVKALEGESKGLVIERVKNITLSNCEFKVSEKGRQRVLKEKCKNIHAGVVGYISEQSEIVNFSQITYNPYKYSNFVNKETLEPVFNSQFAVLNEDRSVQVVF